MGARIGVRIDTKEMEAAIAQLQQTCSEAHIQTFIEGCAKEVAARLLASVIKRTPVGDYAGEGYETYKRGPKKGQYKRTKSGKLKRNKIKNVSFTTRDGRQVNFAVNTAHKKGGTLRRGWTAGVGVKEFVDSLQIIKAGNTYYLAIENNVVYAVYVEYGHRSRSGGWVEGQFMLRAAEKEIREMLPKIIKRRLDALLKEAFKE